MYLFHDKSIDSDHDRIILAFDGLIRIVSRQTYESHGRRGVIQELLRYTSSHFRREEASMRRHRYPGLRDHVLAHAYLQNAFGRIRPWMFEDRPNLLSDIRLLRDLFLSHILTYDESYAEWFCTRKADGSRPGGGRAAEPAHGLHLRCRATRNGPGHPGRRAQPGCRSGVLGHRRQQRGRCGVPCEGGR